MNREIKFEYGFSTDIGTIIKKVYNLHEIPHIKEKCDLWNELPIAYVRQFTGLKDKNGVDIYEGDETDGDEYVIFSNGSFRTTYDGDQTKGSLLTSKRCSYIEVIGNKHTK